MRNLLIIVCLATIPILAYGDVLRIGARDRDQIMVTMYNNGLGMVTDVRSSVLPKGLLELEYQDIAPHIEPTSVTLRSNSAPGSLEILLQSYPHAQLNRRSLLSEQIGNEVLLINDQDDDPSKTTRKVELLAFDPDLIVRYDKRIEINPAGVVALPELPESVRSQPALVWTITNQRKGKHQLAASYLTRGMTWHADHVITLAADDQRMGLQAWATLDNQSGASFEKAQLTLVAGDVKRITPTPVPVRREMAVQGLASMAVDPMPEQPFFEFHLYRIEQPVDLINQRTSQVSMFSRDNISVSRELHIESTAQLYGRERQQRPTNVSVSLLFDNEDANQLGLPLPAGRARVYKTDNAGNLQLLGEDSIKHTAAGEQVRLQIGRSFDVLAERRQLLFRKRGERSSEASYEIRVRNRKSVVEEVKIVEHLNGDWVILNESQVHQKLDSGTIEYQVSVPGGAEAVVQYTVRSGW